LTPIPPVQVFGLFVAFGIATAWVLTIAFVPAYIMMLPERALEGFGAVSHDELEAPRSGLARGLLTLGPAAVRRARPIVIATVAASVVAAWGISLVEINDNPIRWFSESHEIRVADRELNEHFAGTYMAYLALETLDSAVSLQEFARTLVTRATEQGASLAQTLAEAPLVFEKVADEASRTAEQARDVDALLAELDSFVATGYDAAANGSEADAWDAAALFVGEEITRREVFKQPDVLRYVERLSRYLEQSEVIGKTNALPDIVKTVYRELLLGKDENFRIPDRADAVAQTLITYQNSHR
ncbi:MAG: RND transporter, partial [bacterium]|nr:RND transporter [bacterium]